MNKCFALLCVTVLCSAGQVEAQVFYPVAPPPPVHVSLTPSWVCVQPLPVYTWAPVVFTTAPVHFVDDEAWFEVGFNKCPKTGAKRHLSYCINGEWYHVDANGQHFCLGENESGLVGNYFTEPFSRFTGARIPKSFRDVPQGTVKEVQKGIKTHVIREDGTEWFPTWVSREGDPVIHFVWVTAVDVPDPVSIEPTPIEQGPLEIPAVPTEPYSPPVLPTLPSPQPEPFQETKERNIVPDLNGPVAEEFGDRRFN